MTLRRSVGNVRFSVLEKHFALVNAHFYQACNSQACLKQSLKEEEQDVSQRAAELATLHERPRS